MTPEQRRARGYAAKALIDDQTLQAGWELIERDLLDQWQNTHLLNSRKREALWRELKSLKALRTKLASFAGHARD